MDGSTSATAFSHNHHLDSPLCHAPPSHLPPNVDCRVLPPPPTAAHRRQHPDIGIAPPARHRPAASTAAAQAAEASTPTRSCRCPTDAPTPWRRRQNAPTSPADAPARTRRPENAARRQVAHQQSGRHPVRVQAAPTLVGGFSTEIYPIKMLLPAKNQQLPRTKILLPSKKCYCLCRCRFVGNIIFDPYVDVRVTSHAQKKISTPRWCQSFVRRLCGKIPFE